jgi:L-fucose isomerase-like protein
MSTQKTTFALFYGNRSFFPASLIAEARTELPRALAGMGHRTIALEPDATRCGAVETPEEGRKFAAFLAAHRGEFGGVILSLPNFGDENGAVAALRDAGVPILVHAWPDTLDRMRPELRRDSFCGKLSMMDVFGQNGLPFTALAPHVAAPGAEAFRRNVEHFDRVCRVVNGMRRVTVGAIGARTTPFKTVRIDEVALQRRGITVETLDLSEIIARMGSIAAGEEAYRAKAAALQACTSWEGVPGTAFDALVRLGVVLDRVTAEYGMDAIALRCWTELQTQVGVSPCVLLGEMNERWGAAACEVDVGSALAMRALSLASGGPAACLDWNNNYGDDEEKCVLFHCGPVPASLMEPGGRITEHAILAATVGRGCSFGCNVGRIRPGAITFGNLLTDQGRIKCFLGTGRFTADPVPSDFFGCAGVAEIPRLQDVLLHLGREGHRHHVAVAPGSVVAPLREALGRYLGYEVTVPQDDPALQAGAAPISRATSR